ncbi:hypothetical protein NQ315_010792 [Exocentrus adspersus]|uniref:Uncharacterized protein n=1 Tax=Exocentrus adspersus TaxID=1586481 RepID=A0AAV8VV23_9CUCU|nr:hypothetical protein NQ315_010792 [Exocentrus adspersus]
MEDTIIGTNTKPHITSHFLAHSPIHTLLLLFLIKSRLKKIDDGDTYNSLDVNHQINCEQEALDHFPENLKKNFKNVSFRMCLGHKKVTKCIAFLACLVELGILWETHKDRETEISRSGRQTPSEQQQNGKHQTVVAAARRVYRHPVMPFTS